MTKKKKKIIFIILIFIVGIIFGMIMGAGITNLTLAKEKLYVVYFDTDGGTKIERIITKHGEKITPPKSPEKKDYIFKEWQLESKKFDFSKKITKDITLVAKWKEDSNSKKHLVSFDTDGGSSIPDQTILNGKKAHKPENPTKEGYSFVEWTLDGEPFDFENKVTKDIVLKASWKKNQSEEEEEEKEAVTKYTVTFDSVGGSKVYSQKIDEGKKASKPKTPTKTGYAFLEWTLNGKSYNFNTPITKNITLKATWKKVELRNFTITFDSNGGSEIATQTVVEGNKVKKPTNPTRKGYIFSGWTLNGKTYNFNNPVTNNITLKATWKQNSYTIKASAVDSQSPARILTVYENGNKITVQSIKYSDGTLLCSGNNMNVNMYALDGTSYKVVLSDGTEVNATLVS